MTDGTSAGGGRPELPGSASNTGNAPRRISYASVASSGAQQGSTSTGRPGTLAYMAVTTPNTSYPQSNPFDSTYARSHSQEQDNTSTNSKQQYQLPWCSRKYASLPGFGPRTFFVPSYLKESRYVAKLKTIHAETTRNEKDTRPGQQSASLSTSQSSSNANVHRLAPSHRGMTYEVTESNPPKDDEQLLPLPSKWDDQDKYPGLDVFNEGLDVKYNGSASKSDVEAASVRANYPMSSACGIYYYEVEIKSKAKESAVAVGFSTSKASLERLPGWEPESWAYHGDDGKTFCGEHNGRAYNDPFTTGDVIGCGINFSTGHAFFTKNGLDLGVAFREMKNVKAFPCVGIKKYSGAIVSVNFGQRPFVFDIDEKVAQEKMAVDSQIRKTKVSSLHPKLDETSLVQSLVSQFLMHGGYVETSRAFEEDVRRERRSLNNSNVISTQSLSDVDTTNAANRQEIRRAILAGNIDLAFDITNNHYPEVLQRSPDIVFHLKCRKWVELIIKAAELRTRQISPEADRRGQRSSNGSNRPSTRVVEDVFDQQMELDEEHSSTMNGTGKAPADNPIHSADTDVAYSQLLSQAMDYGQVLQREYRDEKNGENAKTLQNIFSLIVYDEPKDSVHGHLLDTSGRVKVAEELNSAVLVYLGRSPTAALENTYKQTEALLDILGSDGGPASFVNLKDKFEQR